MADAWDVPGKDALTSCGAWVARPQALTPEAPGALGAAPAAPAASAVVSPGPANAASVRTTVATIFLTIGWHLFGVVFSSLSDERPMRPGQRARAHGGCRVGSVGEFRRQRRRLHPVHGALF